MAKGEGAWVPWELAVRLPRLALRPPSRCQVFMTVFLTWCRYGCKEARLGAKDIALITGLSDRTVKSALAALISTGLLRRVGRYKRLAIVADALPREEGKPPPSPVTAVETAESAGGANMLAPPRCTHACTSPTCIDVSSKKIGKGGGGFTQRQLTTIQDVMCEIGELLGDDPYALAVPQAFTARLGLPAETTYQMAMEQISTNGTPAMAGKFVAAVLGLRQDPRVQGTELRGGEESDSTPKG